MKDINFQTIQQMFPDTYFPEPKFEPLSFGRRTVFPYSGKKALVDIKSETPTPFAIVSDEYKLTKHEEVLDEVLTALKELPEYGEPDIKPKMINGGAKMIVEITFPEVDFEIRPGDKINPKAIIRNSYDLQWKLSMEYGARQLVCSNGLIAYRKKGGSSMLHRQNLSLLEITKALSEGMAEYSEQVGIWKEWAQKQLDSAETEKILEALPFGEKYNEKILSLPQTSTGLTIQEMLEKDELTKWDMYSVVTQFLTHEVESEMVKAEKGEEVAKIFTTLN